MIVTYQVKYREYLRNIRNRQLERAEANRDVYYINEAVSAQEEVYDGFYAVCTNLDDTASADEIISINKQRWQIEECFRIMKHDFLARPVFLSRDDRIKAHFMTCFIALILYRLLEKQLENKYTPAEILSCLRNMNMTKLEAHGYIPSFKRTVLTDDLHQIFGWDLSKEITSSAAMRKICKLSKNR